MSRKELTVDRYNEIKRQLELRVPVIQIAHNLKCTERTIRLIRDGVLSPQTGSKVIAGPIWSEQMNWPSVLEHALSGHPFSLIWSEVAKDQVGYKAFLDQFHRRYPHYKRAFVVHRHFDPGERCEVDYAGDKVEWICTKSGEVQRAVVFVGILGFSQRIFAEASVDQKGDQFVRSHVRMFKYFGGVPRVTVPDCLKQGVVRCHGYDPEINKSYQVMSEHFKTVIVPARPRRPKDKALVEGAVRIIMRLFKWRYRRHMFVSIAEINEALTACCEEVNNKQHCRFKVSRNQSWRERELAELLPLPGNDFEVATYKIGTVWDDGHVGFENMYYSVPHHLCGEQVELKATDKFIEIYFKSERIALHTRSRRGACQLVTDASHLPDNARAYHEATPQNLLSQSKFITAGLNQLVDTLFKENVYGNLRRVQGLLRVARVEIERSGGQVGRVNIDMAVARMNLYRRVRVPYFQELLASQRGQALQSLHPSMGPSIARGANPYLRHTQKQQLELVINNPN